MEYEINLLPRILRDNGVTDRKMRKVGHRMESKKYGYSGFEEN